MPSDPVIAVGLLSARDLAVLGESFDRYWPVDDTPCFQGLLEAIDEADRKMWQARDEAEPEGEKPEVNQLSNRMSGKSF